MPENNASQTPYETVDALEMKLGELAARFRRNAVAQDEIVTEYAETMQKLLRFEQWCGEPDVDSQLPDELMPDDYKRYWSERLGHEAQSTSLNQTNRAVPTSAVAVIDHEFMIARDFISLAYDEETFKLGLANLIQLENLEFGLPSARDSDRITTASRQVGRLAIFLRKHLEGEYAITFIRRVCEGILSLAGIRLDVDVERELAEKLEVEGVSHQDVSDTVQRHCRELRSRTKRA